MASGEPCIAHRYAAAHKTLPLGTKLVVSYKGRSVPVTVNDREPYVGDRDLDLSDGVAQELELTQAGVDYVEYSFADGASYGVSYAAPQVAAGTGACIVQPGDTFPDCRPPGDFRRSSRRAQRGGRSGPFTQ
jgi:rare lipoprotein A